MAIRASVNVSITPELERFVQDLVASGRYHSASEVFRDGLRLLERAEHRRLLEKWLAEGLTPDEEAKLAPGLLGEARARIEAKIREGLDALDRHEALDGDEFFARWKARLGKAATAHPSSRVKRRR
jgi:putative addiction module CopG family antidote